MQKGLVDSSGQGYGPEACDADLFRAPQPCLQLDLVSMRLPVLA